MNKKIFFSDLEIIVKALLPENAGIWANRMHPDLIANQDCKKYYEKEGICAFVNLQRDSKRNVENFQYVLDFKNTISSNSHERIRFSYINNPDGTMRWIYPESNKYPGFLSFYNASTLIATIYKAVVKNIFKLGFKNLVRSGSFTLFYKSDLTPIVTNLLKEKRSFSLFTGTVGLSRKMQIEVNRENKTEYFIKLPLTEYSKELILREKRNLTAMHMQKPSRMNVPALIPSGDKYVMLSENLQKATAKSSPFFTSIHAQALDEMYQCTLQQLNTASLKCMEASIKNIEWLNKQTDFRFDRRLLQGLTEISAMINKNKIIPTGRAHKDFTPWNIFLDKKNIYVIDWEASERNIPLLYDFFHFHFQTGILIQRKSFSEIITLIHERANDPEIRDMILKYGINLEYHLALYLLINVSEFLVLYQKQETLHLQVQWLIQTWTEAIHYVNLNQNQRSVRQYFIQDFISSISTIPYTWMKYEGKKLSDLSEETDIDLLINKSDLPKILEYIKLYEPLGKIKRIRKSNMTTVSIYFHNQEFLSIDLIYQFKRNQYWYLDPAKILIHPCLNSDKVKVPQRHHDFEYILLFYTLNKSGIPAKYYHQFQALLPDEKKAILNYVNHRYALNAASLEELMSKNQEIRSALFKNVKMKFKQNRPWNFLKNIRWYLTDLCKDFFYNRGFMLTVSGVDGAGKSTVIESLKNSFETKFRKKVKILRHRPSVFPILSSYLHGKSAAEQKAANTLPRQGRNKNFLSSLIRFSYYFLDYQIGQVYVFFKYICRGYIVIYDRYYFDFIQDSKRTNIHLPSSLTGFLYRFIYKPQLNVLLYASPEVILKRKQELTEREITEMTFSYRKLFNGLAKKYETDLYLMIENVHKESTINKIIKNYCKVA